MRSFVGAYTRACVCVRDCVRACLWACVRACVPMCLFGHPCTHVRAQLTHIIFMRLFVRMCVYA